MGLCLSWCCEMMASSHELTVKQKNYPRVASWRPITWDSPDTSLAIRSGGRVGAVRFSFASAAKNKWEVGEKWATSWWVGENMSLQLTLTSSLHLLDHKRQILVSVTCVLVFSLRANCSVFTEVKLLLLNGGFLAWIFLDLILGDPVNSSFEATTRSFFALPLSLRALFILGSAMLRGFQEPLCGCSSEIQAPNFHREYESSTQLASMQQPGLHTWLICH